MGEGDVFLRLTLLEDRGGLADRGGDTSWPILWFEQGGATTVVHAAEVNLLFVVFVPETGEATVPFEMGGMMEVTCHPGLLQDPLRR
jgi:hypothetical protein